MRIKKGVYRKVIAVTPLVIPPEKGPFRISFKPSFALYKKRRVKDMGSSIGQFLRIQKVLVQKDLVKENPFLFVSGGAYRHFSMDESI